MANATLNAIEDDRTAPSARWYVLFVMTLIYTFNIADRFVVSTLIEPIKTEFVLSDAAVGVLTGAALAVFYVTAGIPLGMMADRISRKRMIVASLAVWSVLTAICGLTRSYGQLLAMRIGVGVGEAGGTPPAQSLLADIFPAESRAFAMSLYALGAAAGAALASVIGGLIADSHGWRAVFIFFGLMGLPVALLAALTVREPLRGRHDADGGTAAPSFAEAIRIIRKSKPLTHLLVGTAAITFAGWGLVWWVPTFLLRSHGMSLQESGVVLGSMHGIGGVAVTMLTAWAMGAYAARGWRFQSLFVAAVTALVTIPAVIAFATASKPLALAMLWIVVPSIYLYIGPTLGIAQNLTPANMRGIVCALILFVANAANLVIAPILIGLLSDLVAPRVADPAESLRYVLTVMAFAGFWAAWHYLAASRPSLTSEMPNP